MSNWELSQHYSAVIASLVFEKNTASVWCVCFPPQKEKAKMQEMLNQLSKQLEAQNAPAQPNPAALLSNELFMQNTLIQNLYQVVADKEDTIKELEDQIKQLPVSDNCWQIKLNDLSK